MRTTGSTAPKGLVHEQDGRVGGERAGHADALLLAAGELVRVALACVGGETDGLQELGRSCPAFLAAEPSSSGTVATLSSTVRCGKRPACWMTYPMERRRSAASCSRTSLPPTRMVPEVGSTIRSIIRRVVVLPQPEDPTRTVTPPSGISRERSWTAVVPLGKRLWTVSNWIMRCPLPGLHIVMQSSLYLNRLSTVRC